MPQDARDDRLLGEGRKLPPPTQWRKNGGNDAQEATAAKRKVARLPPPTQWRKTGPHIQIKDAAQKSDPGPIRGSCLRFFAFHTLLTRCGDDRRPERAMRRQTAGIAHQVRTRQRHDGGKFFDTDKAVEHALKMAEDGATIIDVGPESTRPGAEPVIATESV